MDWGQGRDAEMVKATFPLGIVGINYSDPGEDFEGLRPGDESMLTVLVHKMLSLPQVGAVILSSEPNLQLHHSTGQGPVRIYGLGPRLPTGFLQGSEEQDEPSGVGG